jgi:cytochrome c peroxidase
MIRGTSLLVAAVCAASPWADPVPVPPEVRDRLLRLGPMPTVPADPTNRVADDAAAADLGRWLFFDTGLSANGQVSCATCHQPDAGFADGRRLARGIGIGARHSQSLLDAAHQRWFTWDGRADSLWSQALHPFENPPEMGLSRLGVIDRVRREPELRERYEAVFGTLPPEQAFGRGCDSACDTAFANIGKAIAAYERRIVTGPSAFDRWLERLRVGDAAPIEGFGPAEIRGAVLFAGRADCIRCHSGPLLSDGEFHLIGVPEPDGGLPRDRGRLEGIERLRKDPFNAAGAHSDDPSGPKAAVTRATRHDPEAWGRMRTPSLRHAAITPPYMHQGQLATLEAVVRFYSTLEGATALDHHAESLLEPLELTDQQSQDLVAFLRAVQGSPPKGAEFTDPWVRPTGKSVESGSKSPPATFHTGTVGAD